MSTVRYGLALIIVIVMPPALLFWVLIHPFVRCWRTVGPAWAYGLLGGLIALVIVGLFLLRRPLLAVEFGTNYPLLVGGMLCLAAAGWLRLRLHRHMGSSVLMGLPELAPERHPTRLVTEGLYARMRHPRYVQVSLALLGYALIANYLALYLVFALWLPALSLIVRLEECELRERFGPAYEEYCRRVPRFAPCWRRDP
ncbi:MAG: methyltransferase family protein [Candidatus Entotheonellia bacterium]